MKRKLMTLLIGATLAATSGIAAAHERVSFGLFVGVPGYAYEAPPPVYYAPPAVYYAPPVRTYYYAPAPWGVRVHGGHHRGWERRHWH